MALSKDALIQYLSEHATGDLTSLTDDTELFSSGLIDSFAMVDLLMFLEQQTGAKLGPEDISLENFDSIARIMAFAERTSR